MPAPDTISEIDAAAQQAEQAIGALQADLQEEQRQIRRQAFLADRALTPDEVKRLADIGVAQKGLANALIQLSFVTLQTLDNTDTVKRLQTRMKRTNTRLTGELASLQQLEALSATIAKVADTTAQVVAKLVQLAAGAAA